MYKRPAICLKCYAKFTSLYTLNNFTCTKRTYSSQNKHTEHYFGFQSVSENDKASKVHQVFENVASKYNKMNDVMSLGIHRVWKDYFLSIMDPPPGTKLLDVAGGTGDIAFRFLDYISDNRNTQKATIDNPFNSVLPIDDDKRDGDELPPVTVCDISESMIHYGRMRSKELGYAESDLNWVIGDAEKLPFANDMFDVYTISFGIRNCTHINLVLQEAHRVLRPGGRFMCLEFSHVNHPLISRLYDAYSFQIIPVMGQVVAGDWSSYQYLVESIRQFPNQEEFKVLVEESGFGLVTYTNLSFGIACIHNAFKLPVKTS